MGLYRLLGTSLVCGAFVFMIATGTTSNPCGADESLQSTLQQRYDDMKVAMDARDPDALAAIIATDFSSVDVSGKTTSMAQTLAEIEGIPTDPNRVSKTSLLSVTEDGNSAIVEQRYDMTTTKTGADGVSHAIEVMAISTDTWVQQSGLWVIRQTVTREMAMSKDGQIVFRKVSP